jgi:hypothetical protein
MRRGEHWATLRRLDPTGFAIDEHRKSKSLVKLERIGSEVHVVMRTLRRKRPTWEVVAYFRGRRWATAPLVGQGEVPLAGAFLTREDAEDAYEEFVRRIMVAMAAYALGIKEE